jgi:hypothetical protein
VALCGKATLEAAEGSFEQATEWLNTALQLHDDNQAHEDDSRTGDLFKVHFFS